MLHADSARNRLTGIGLISLTYVLFTLLDGSAKWLVQSVPDAAVWIGAAIVVCSGLYLFARERRAR
ncbi:MAG: hypothetical protein ACREU4_01195 [Burkholderiales bacterium]